MKSIHFCTPEKLKSIKLNQKPEDKYFVSIRTGWIPTLYPGDIVKINERVTEGKINTDTYLFNAKIVDVTPIQYKKTKMSSVYTEEIARYGREFHPDHWFFIISFCKEKLKTMEAFL